MTTWRPSKTPRAEREATALARSLAGEVRRLGGPDAALTTAVFAHWEELAGPTVAGHSRPVSLRDGVLTVAVDQPAWATQLRYLSASVLDRVAEVTGRRDITELRVTVEGEGPRRQRR